MFGGRDSKLRNECTLTELKEGVGISFSVWPLNELELRCHVGMLLSPNGSHFYLPDCKFFRSEFPGHENGRRRSNCIPFDSADLPEFISGLPESLAQFVGELWTKNYNDQIIVTS